MSFLDYLKDHRGQFIDHRATAPAAPGISVLELELATDPPLDPAAQAGLETAGRRRRARTAPRGVRLRHVRPAFAPSPYSDPLPYEEPWERAWR